MSEFASGFMGVLNSRATGEFFAIVVLPITLLAIISTIYFWWTKPKSGE